MKIFGVIGTAVMFLAFGTVGGFAQQPDEKPRQEEAKPEEKKAEHPQEQKQGERPDQRQAPKPEQRQAPKADQRAQQENDKRAQENAKQAQDNQRKAQQQEQHAQQDNQKRTQQDQQRARQDQQKQMQQNQKAQQQNARDQQKARDDEQRRAQQDRDREGNRSYPAQSQGREAAYHGRIPENNFHEHFGQQHHFRFHRPEVIEGRPRFQYSGYWFELVDPWPVGWGYDDDVYVDYVDDQYYLFDPEHPGARIVINVVL